MKIMHLISAASLAMVAALAQTPASTQANEMTGVCSYYARMHNGHVTAGGEKFDSNAMTAAHRQAADGHEVEGHEPRQWQERRCDGE